MLDNEHSRAACMLCGSGRSAVYYHRDGNDHILRCLQCGLLFVSPRPAKEKLEELYRASDPGYILRYKDRIFRRGRKILNAVQKFKKKGVLLDVGCGYGFFMDLAEKNGWKTKGVELSPAGARFARENFGLDVFTGNITEARLADKSFDLISLQHTLEHIPEPLDMLITLRNKLKDDGILSIAVPNALSLAARSARINWVCLSERTHLFHYTKKTLRLLLEKTGFIPISIGTFEWDTRELLWGLKMLLTARNGSGERCSHCPSRNLSTNPPPVPQLCQEQTDAAGTEETAGRCNKIICRAAFPLSWAAGKLGLGAEIIVLAKKRITLRWTETQVRE
jgi:SAM-dependent methyltransferase